MAQKHDLPEWVELYMTEMFKWAFYRLSDEEQAKDVVQDTFVAADEKIQLKAHKAMCSACTNYEKQSYFMDKALSHPYKPTDPSLDISTLKKETISEMEKNKTK